MCCVVITIRLPSLKILTEIEILRMLKRKIYRTSRPYQIFKRTDVETSSVKHKLWSLRAQCFCFVFFLFFSFYCCLRYNLLWLSYIGEDVFIKIFRVLFLFAFFPYFIFFYIYLIKSAEPIFVKFLELKNIDLDLIGMFIY